MTQRLRRVLVEFEQDGKIKELEIKNVLEQDGKFELNQIHDPDNGHHFAIMEIRVVKRGKENGGDDTLFTVREVKGS